MTSYKFIFIKKHTGLLHAILFKREFKVISKILNIIITSGIEPPYLEPVNVSFNQPKNKCGNYNAECKPGLSRRKPNIKITGNTTNICRIIFFISVLISKFTTFNLASLRKPRSTLIRQAV
jgi:hypothetical protein